MQRIRLYIERTGYPQTFIYLIVIAAVLHSYYELWPLPGGREYVLSVLILGLGIGTFLAQFLYHFPDRGTSLATISGLTIWAIFLLVNYLKLPLPVMVHWMHNLLFWMQIAICFLIGSYVPKADRDWCTRIAPLNSHCPEPLAGVHSLWKNRGDAAPRLP